MKKLISLISAFSLLASLSFSVSAAYTEPTIYLEATTTGYKAGDTVTVTCKYDGFNVTPYDEAETGAGQVVTGTQIRIAIPGGIGAASANKQFVRAGATSAHSFTSGSSQLVYDVNNNYFTCVVGGITDPMNPSGTVWTISMKLQNDITSDLVFDFVDGYEQNITYDNYADWTMGDTVMVSNATLVPYTLKAPAPANPVGQQIADGAYYVGAKELAGLTDNTKFVIKYGAQSKNIGQTLGEILGGVSVGNLQGKLHFAIKPVSVDASTLDFSQFVIDTVNE